MKWVKIKGSYYNVNKIIKFNTKDDVLKIWTVTDNSYTVIYGLTKEELKEITIKILS